jgi:hypothetical protein
VNGAGAVAGLVALEWAAGWIAVAAWTQSWSVVRRGHFRIVAWGTLFAAALALVTGGGDPDSGLLRGLLIAFCASTLLYLIVQYSRTDLPGVVVGSGAGLAGGAALVVAAGRVDEWPLLLAAAGLLAGAALLGAVTNGMLLGHWYLNQPGLKSWALARLTLLGLVVTALSILAGLAGAGRLSSAETEGAVLGIPGFGDSFGAVFLAVWILLVGFTGAVVWMARRCIAIKSIQSATGLYYVALLTAGVAEFVVRYLMVNAS